MKLVVWILLLAASMWPRSAGQGSPDQIVFSVKDDDVYAMLSNTLPQSSLPADVIFTTDNFDEKIALAKKTAVVFYIGWSPETRLLLQHLKEAREKLDTSKSVRLGSVDCHAHTRTCYRFNVSHLPSVLLFTSSPSSPPVVSPLGVIDATHLLLALGQEVEPPRHQTQLSEVTPASLPVLLRNTLDMPLVLLCSDSPTSKLGKAFAQAIQGNTETYSDVSFAWLNSMEHSRLLEVAFSLKGQQFPSIIAIRFAQSAVYSMEGVHMLQPDTLREKLTKFLNLLKDGSLSPTSQLAGKEWPPLQPPITFPSSSMLEKLGMSGKGGSKDEL